MGLESFLFSTGKNGAGIGLPGWLGGPWGTAATAFAPMLLGSFFNGQDPLRRMQARAQGFLSPEHIAGLRSQMYRDTIGGAGFADAQRAATAGAGQFQRALGPMSGFGASGVGRLRGAMGASLLGNHMSKLYGAADSAAGAGAMDLARAQANAVMSGGVPQNYTATFGAAGLNALLAKYLAGSFNSPQGMGNSPSLERSFSLQGGLNAARQSQLAQELFGQRISGQNFLTLPWGYR